MSLLVRSYFIEILCTHTIARSHRADCKKKRPSVVVWTSRLNLSDENVFESCYHLFRTQAELPSWITATKVFCSVFFFFFWIYLFVIDWLFLHFNHSFPRMKLNDFRIVNPFETMYISCNKRMISNMVIIFYYECFTIHVLWLFIFDGHTHTAFLSWRTTIAVFAIYQF